MNYTQIQNSLSNYANTISVAQPQSITDEAYGAIENYFLLINEEMKVLQKSTSTEQEEAVLNAFANKHATVQDQALAAIANKDSVAARSLANRILGLLNDVYTLNMYAETEYDYIQSKLNKQISNTIIIAMK